MGMASERSGGYVVIKMFMLGALLASQIMMIVSTHSRIDALKSEEGLWKHPAKKELKQQSDQMDDHLVVSYMELFEPENQNDLCGFIIQTRWFPPLPDEKEKYTAFLYDNARQSASREFQSLAEAE
jgi:hypothetical protein